MSRLSFCVGADSLFALEAPDGWSKPGGICSLLMLLANVRAACATGTYLSDPPILYLQGKNYPSDNVARPVRTSTPKIFYVTGRTREGARAGPAETLCGAVLAGGVSRL